MKNTPHWQLLLLLYVVIVAVPVYIVHLQLKQKLISKKKTAKSLLLYAAGVIAAACVLYQLTMFMYFKFIFSK